MGEYVIGIIGPFWNPLTFFLSSVSFFKFIFVSQVPVIVIVEGLLDWIYCVSSRERVFFPWICVLS